MRRNACLALVLVLAGLGCGGISNPFSRGPKTDPRFLDYGPPPLGHEQTIRTSIEGQVVAPDVLKGVEIGEPKKGSYFPPALNAAGSAKPVEYLGWKVDAKYTVTSPGGGVVINRRSFFFNTNELIAVEKTGSGAMK